MTHARDIVLAAHTRQRAGGHTWALRHWARGLRRIGRRAVVVDPAASDRRHEGRLTRPAQRLWAPASSRVRSAAGVLNVMGALPRDALAHADVWVFVDIDPGYPQMWRELGLADMFAGHDRFVTIGENIGQEGCAIPDCGIDWITTPPPVALDAWAPEGAGGGRAFTTVATWRNHYGTVTFDGVTYGSRVHEFRKFIELPRLVDAEFELALDIGAAEVRDLRALESCGWRLVDPRRVAGTPSAYRAYIQGSRAELCVAQNMYVATRSGWLSDRSLCYLAAGKPVLAQDTGFSARYPVGEGLIAFSTLEEAAAGVQEIERNYERHSRAARALAEEHFDAGKVLARLLERLELPLEVPAR
jgi:hypothetical protein